MKQRIIGIITVLASIATIITVIPIISDFLGCNEKYTECEKQELALIKTIEEINESFMSFSALTTSMEDLNVITNEIQNLRPLIELNLQCPDNKEWGKELKDFTNLLHTQTTKLISEWDEELAKRDDKRVSTDLFYEGAILEISKSCVQLCRVNENICNKNILKAFENVLDSYKKRGFITD